MIDPQRHLSVFDPDKFNPTPVHIIGCGATGSKIAISLAKLGITRIHLWDLDYVEPHNIANQAFGNNHLGFTKVGALAMIIEEATGLVCVQHEQMVEKKEAFEGVVFLLVDSMEARKNIFETSIKNNFKVKQMIETRMGARHLMVYTITPCKPGEIKGWEDRFYTDDKAEVSACGASVSVGPTADLVSGLAVWQLINWANEDTPANEIIMSIQPVTALTFDFNSF